MFKKAILGWNCAPGAPANWEPEKHGECGALPIRVFPPEAVTHRKEVEVQYCESAWEPSVLELEYLNQGGQVVLRVAGWQCPVNLYVEPPPEEVGQEISAGFARGYAMAVGQVSNLIDEARDMHALQRGLSGMMSRLKVTVGNYKDTDAEVIASMKLGMYKRLLAVAVNALVGDDFAQTDRAREYGAEILRDCLAIKLVELDDLHHAPRCPANHFNNTRLPTAPCTCGAQKDAEAPQPSAEG